MNRGGYKQYNQVQIKTANKGKQDIILELLYAVDQKMVDSGNELALNLQSLYLYSYRRLVQANIHIDVEAIEEVVGLMNNLLDAWEQVTGGEKQDEGDAAPTSGVALTG